MTRDDKAGLISAMQERFEKASVALVATNKGLTVEQANRLRRTLRGVGAEYKVTKHTLTRLALEPTRYRTLKGLLRGPQGVVFGYSDPVTVTKALVNFAADVEKLQIDGGSVDGQLIAADGVKALATMPDLPVLRGRVIAQVRGPGNRVASMTLAPAQRLAGAIAALISKLESADSPAESGAAQ